MDTKNKSLFKLTTALIVAASIAAGVFAVLAYVYEFESPIGHFIFGAVYAPTFQIISAVCAAAAIISSLYFNSKVTIIPPLPTNAAVIFTGAISGAMMIVYSIIDLVDIIGVSGTSVMLIVRDIIGIPAGLCFIFLALANPKKVFGSPAYALFSFLPVIWGAISLLFFYFDSTYALNSPVRISMQLMYVSVMLFLPHDSRFILGRNKTGSYIFTGLCTVTFTGIVAFAGFFSSLSAAHAFSFKLPECFLYLSLWGYALTRMFTASEAIRTLSPSQKADAKAKRKSPQTNN